MVLQKLQQVYGRFRPAVGVAPWSHFNDHAASLLQLQYAKGPLQSKIKKEYIHKLHIKEGFFEFDTLF